MGILDKTRKILWGRSGNRCVMCRQMLIADATTVDDESVIGDECHIVSGQPLGPRHDAGVPQNEIDEYKNLVLLCRAHHKLVDDQASTYTPDLLHSLKKNHENWVISRLEEKKEVAPIRVRKIKGKELELLRRLWTGNDALAVVGGASAFQFDHAEPTSNAEAELIAAYLRNLQDVGDLFNELNAGDRVKLSFELSSMMKELETHRLIVFGGVEVRRLEGGVCPPSEFPIAMVRVVRWSGPLSDAQVPG